MTQPRVYGLGLFFVPWGIVRPIAWDLRQLLHALYSLLLAVVVELVEFLDDFDFIFRKAISKFTQFILTFNKSFLV